MEWRDPGTNPAALAPTRDATVLLRTTDTVLASVSHDAREQVIELALESVQVDEARHLVSGQRACPSRVAELEDQRTYGVVVRSVNAPELERDQTGLLLDRKKLDLALEAFERREMAGHECCSRTRWHLTTVLETHSGPTAEIRRFRHDFHEASCSNFGVDRLKQFSIFCERSQESRYSQEKGDHKYKSDIMKT